MSQLFDALQRSESERNGAPATAASRALDLLQRAEQGGAPVRSSWSSILVEDPPVSAEPEKVTMPVSAELVTPSTARADPDGAEGPIHCEVLQISPSADSHLVALPENESSATEAFHLLGVRLRHLRRQKPLKKVLVTSTIPQEGKSMIAANLACTLALRTQQKVLLVEGDIRRPTQSRIFGLQVKTGICSWLNGENSLIRSMYRLALPGIWILPAGMATGNSLELLQSGRVIPMMEQLTSWFDWVVIDSPPILPLADTSVWTNMADGILLVARQGTTQKKQLKRGLEALSGQKVIGAVLNSAKSAVHSDYYYRPTNRLPTDDAEG